MFPKHGIYVNRRGIENPFGKQLPKVLNVFSAKSSRVVGALLHEPLRERQLRLTRPDDLWDDWVKHYRTNKPREYSFYMHGELEQIEQQIANWCSKFTKRFALSRFSAAWQLAPEVRYGIASFMVPTAAIRAEPLAELGTKYGARKIDSGANLILQISDDESYLSNILQEVIPTTSPLQTYLDLRAMDGRGEEAAMAIHERYFMQPFKEAADRLSV